MQARCRSLSQIATSAAIPVAMSAAMSAALATAGAAQTPLAQWLSPDQALGPDRALKEEVAVDGNRLFVQGEGSNQQDAVLAFELPGGAFVGQIELF